LFLLPNVLPLGFSLLLATKSCGFAEVTGAVALGFVDGNFPATFCCGRLPFCSGSMTLRSPLGSSDSLPYFEECADEIVVPPRHSAEYRRAADSSLIVSQEIGELLLSKAIERSFGSDLVSQVEKRLDVRRAKALVFSHREDDRHIPPLAVNHEGFSLGFVENLVQTLPRLRLANPFHGYSLVFRCVSALASCGLASPPKWYCL
jgi:hypothetical protein